ncbi:MAG: YchJ family metal-binding protein [Thalassolituus sp.]
MSSAVNAAGCPCGNDASYQECCGPLHQGASAASPEALMRSRYTAFAQENADYLLRSWHKDYRPQTLDFADDTQWLGLTILDNSEEGDRGTVHFVARFREGKEWFELEENSRFQRDGKHWYYEAGDAQFRPLLPGRNDPCPCGSGSKFKKCCAH